MATPYMGFTLPVVGVNGTLGPTWATYINQALEIIDSHDHTTNNGIKITPLAININANFSLNSYALTTVNYAKFVNQTGAVSDYTTVYAKNGDLFWKNASGQEVQITSGINVNVAAGGNITGLGGTTGALTYSTATTPPSFLFTSNAGITANVAHGAVFIYDPVTNGKYAKLAVPSGLSANYNLTLPSALPASKKIVTMSLSGAIAADYDVDNSTLEISSNNLRLKDNGISTAKIQNAAITNDKIGQKNYIISSESVGSFVTLSSTFVNIKNSVSLVDISCTITTTGRPVFIGWIQDGTAGASMISAAANSSNLEYGFKFLRDSTSFGFSIRYSSVGSQSIYQDNMPTSIFQAIDFPAAGTYTYKAQIRITQGSSVGIYYSKLLVYEL
jgi:hypothetical protein